MVTMSTKLASAVGDKTAKPMEKALGLRTVEDLLRHYPRRYAEIGSPTDLSALRVGQYATVLAEVVSAKVIPFRNQPRRSRTEVVVTDGTAAADPHVLPAALAAQADDAGHARACSPARSARSTTSCS